MIKNNCNELKLRFDALDTIRVFSGFLVFISHYSSYFENSKNIWIYENVSGLLGRVGVILFFFISGFLAARSISRDSISVFYIKKYVSIIFPYVFSYLVISFLFFTISLWNGGFFKTTPLANLFTGSLELSDFIPTLFGMDGIINSHFDTDYPFFVGEWFVGTIIFLYLLSPLVFIFLKKGCGIKFLVFSVVLSIYIFNNIELNNIFWFFLCRLPEFFFGMLVFHYLSYINKHKKFILLISVTWFFLVVLASAYFFPGAIRGDAIFPMTPRSFLASFSLMLVVYIISDFINNGLKKIKINYYAKYLYVFIIIHHIVLERYMGVFPVKDFNLWGYVGGGVFLISITLIFSIKIAETSKLIEGKILNALIK